MSDDRLILIRETIQTHFGFDPATMSRCQILTMVNSLEAYLIESSKAQVIKEPETKDLFSDKK